MGVEWGSENGGGGGGRVAREPWSKRGHPAYINSYKMRNNILIV